MTLQPASRELIRGINRNSILNLIKTRGPISRARVAELVGLVPATVSAISRELLESGLVREVGAGDSRGGRKPILLELNAQGGYTVGVKLTETEAIAALTDLDANLLACQSYPLDTSREPSEVLEQVAQAVRDVRGGHPILGLGVGLAGVVDHGRGILRYSPILGWRDLAIAEPLARELALPVYVDNDVNTLTIAEQWFGLGRGVNDFVVVTLGRGIGMGLVLNGQFYRGASGGAGELGHITVNPAGARCSCGKRGCLEVEAADPALARAGHAREAQERAGVQIGIALANVVNLLNPDLIILAGEGVQEAPDRLRSLQNTLRAHVFAPLAESLRLEVEPSGDETWARGAASLVLGEVFRPPVYASAVTPIKVPAG